MIETNLQEFTALYPHASVIPKMHFILHIARYIERYVTVIMSVLFCVQRYMVCYPYSVGPMLRHYTMRFEAKHQYFKRLATSMGNYINLAHSLSYRHQCYQCYQLQNEDILSPTIETTSGVDI